MQAHLLWLWDAFWMLSGGRTYGGGMVPVPNGIAFEAIDAYGRRARLDDPEAFFRFARTMRAMDATYRDAEIKRAAKAQKLKRKGK